MKSVGVLIAALAISISPTASAQDGSSVTPSALPVGRIANVSPESAHAVVVSHNGGSPSAGGIYEPIYNGDAITVTGQGVTVTLEMADADGGMIKITDANSPYRVHSHFSGSSTLAAAKDFLKKFSYVFNPPRTGQEVPAMAMGAAPISGISASFYLPPDPPVQRVRAAMGQTFAVPWTGPAAQVLLMDAQGTVIANTPAKQAQPGFALVKCRPLSAGSYRLQINGGSSSLSISIVADSGVPSLRGGYDDQALDAANSLQNSGAQLQALSDLQSIYHEDFLAKAIMDKVRAGRVD